MPAAFCGWAGWSRGALGGLRRVTGGRGGRKRAQQQAGGQSAPRVTKRQRVIPARPAADSLEVLILGEHNDDFQNCGQQQPDLDPAGQGDCINSSSLTIL